MGPPPHHRSDFRPAQVLIFQLAWAKSDVCWPASVNIFDHWLVGYLIEFRRLFKKQPDPSLCSLASLPMLLALGPSR
jgi:hypothetical protein